MEYETGRWHFWDGKSECPFNRNTTEYYLLTVDGSKDGWHDLNLRGGSYGGSKVLSGKSHSGYWKWNRWSNNEISGSAAVLAFYIISYNEPKEMTVAEIQEALGYNIKIVK